MTRTLVVRLDSVGDVLLTGPAVAVAASAGPVDYVASSVGAPAAQLLPGVDRVITFDAPWILDPAPDTDEARISAFVNSIDGPAYSGAAILTSSHQSCLPTALLLRLAGVGRIAAISLDYPGSLLDHRIKGDPNLHEVQRSLAVMAQLGLSEGDPHPHLRIALEAGEPVEGRVVVHPGAAVPARTLAPGRWAECVESLARHGYEVVVTGSNEERNVCAMVASSLNRPPILFRRSDLRGLAEVLASADVVVTGNTGPAHLAAAVGRPVVSIFPPTVPPSRWAPWGVPCVLLGDPLIECAGCRARRCPLPQQWCLDDVTPEAVVRAVAELSTAPVMELVP